MFCVSGVAALWTATNERLVGLTVRPGVAERSGALLPPPPPPPPLQAASSSTRATHSPCPVEEARLIRLPPLAFAPDDRSIRRCDKLRELPRQDRKPIHRPGRTS